MEDSTRNNVILSMPIRSAFIRSIWISAGIWTFLFVALFVRQLLHDVPDTFANRTRLISWLLGLVVILLVRFAIHSTRRLKARWFLAVVFGLLVVSLVSLGGQFVLKKVNETEIYVEEGPPRKEAVVIRENGEVKEIRATVGKSHKVVTYDLLWMYILAAAIVFMTTLVMDLNSHKLERYKLQNQLSMAELNVLRSQLNPHFLFNALNTVSSLIDENTRDAQRVLESFSQLLRDVIDRSKEQFVTLEEEVQFIERYVSIEQIRFEKPWKLNVSIAPETLMAKFPAMTLQPLVENAIKHGIWERKEESVKEDREGGKIDIIAEEKGGRLQVLVRDDGPGAEPGQLSKGAGLTITEHRLKSLYKDDFMLLFKNAAGGGLEVTIEIPFEEWNGSNHG